MVYGLLGGLWWWSSPPPPPSDDAPRGIVLSDVIATTALHNDKTATTLHADQIVSVLAVSTTLRPGRDGDWLAWPTLLVSDGVQAGWVSAEFVATEQTLGASDWPGERISRRTASGGTLWAAAHTGLEIDEEDGPDWFHAESQGWLVMERGDRVERLPLVRESSWGSALRVEGIVWRDLTGDGAPEALIEILETVTEVGAAGRTLHVFDFSRSPLAPLLSIPVDDPPWSYVGGRDRLGWVDVFVDDARIEKTAAALLTDGHGVRRLSQLVEQWRWDGSEFAYSNTPTALTATLSAGSVCTEPSGVACAVVPAQQILLDEIRGQFIEGEVFWVLVRAPDTSALGWVPSTRLRFREPMMHEILTGQQPEAPDYLRYDWER